MPWLLARVYADVEYGLPPNSEGVVTVNRRQVVGASPHPTHGDVEPNY